LCTAEDDIWLATECVEMDCLKKDILFDGLLWEMEVVCVCEFESVIMCYHVWMNVLH